MNKLKLNLDSIKYFIDLASKVESVSDIALLPTAEYIKLEIVFGDCFLTKTSIRSYVKHRFDSEEDDFECLINEKILRTFCSTLSNESKYLFIEYNEIESKTENFIEIKISDNEKLKNFQKFTYLSSCINVANFPKTHDSEEDKTIRITSDVIQYTNIAKNFMHDDVLIPTFNCIYLTSKDKDGIIYASDRQRIFIKTFKNQNFNDISLTIEECRFINGFSFLDYVVTENYNIYKFNNKNTVFGFRKYDNMTGFNYEQFIYKEEKFKNNYVIINVEDLLLFCIRTKNLIAANQKANQFSTHSIFKIDKSESKIITTYEGNEYSVENRNEFEYINSNGIFNDFKFPHYIWHDMLKVLPFKEIKITNFGDNQDEVGFFANFLSITSSEDESFYCCIGKAK